PAVVHPAVDEYVDAVELVDDVLDALEPGEHVVVDRQSREVTDRLAHQLRTTQGEGGVDLALTVAGDLHPAVAREAEDRPLHRARVDGEQVQRVGPRPA